MLGRQPRVTGPIGLASVAVVSGRSMDNPNIAYINPESVALADIIGKAEARGWDQTTQLTVVGARMAIGNLPRRADDRQGLILGTHYGNMSAAESYYTRLYKRGPRLASPLQFAYSGAGVPGATAALDLGLRGYHLTVSHGRLSGPWAILLGMVAIDGGRADRVLTGAVDGISETRSTIEPDAEPGCALLVLDRDCVDCWLSVSAHTSTNEDQAVHAALTAIGLAGGTELVKRIRPDQGSLAMVLELISCLATAPCVVVAGLGDQLTLALAIGSRKDATNE